MTGYTPIYNLPYVEPSDLVASYPTVSEELAENVEAAILGASGVVQVQSTTKSNTFASAGGSLTWEEITGLSVSITPTVNTNKVLILCNTYWGNSANITGIFLRALRNGTVIGVGDTAGNRTPVGFGGIVPGNSYQQTNFTYMYLDSPATTSATTYKIEVATNAQVARLNYRGDDADSADYGRWISTITAMEIKA